MELGTGARKWACGMGHGAWSMCIGNGDWCMVEVLKLGTDRTDVNLEPSIQIQIQPQLGPTLPICAGYCSSGYVLPQRVSDHRSPLFRYTVSEYTIQDTVLASEITPKQYLASKLKNKYFNAHSIYKFLK